MIIKRSEETIIEFTVDELMPMLLDALKRHKIIEYHNQIPTLRVKKKSATLNEPDTIEFITIKYNERNDNLIRNHCIGCDKLLDNEYMSNMNTDGEIPYHDGDGPYCDKCLSIIIGQSD